MSARRCSFLAALGAAAVFGALLVAAPRLGEARPLSCVPPDGLVHRFRGGDYRVVRTRSAVRRGSLVGQALREPCRDVVIPCSTVDCVEVDEPIRVPVVRIEGVRPWVAVAQRAPSPVLYVRASLCRGTGAGQRLLACLARASRDAPRLAVARAVGAADLRLTLLAGGQSADALVAVAHVENLGPAVARGVVVSFGFAGPVAVQAAPAGCRSLVLCTVEDVPAGDIATVVIRYARVPPAFAPLGAVVTAATRDPNRRDNRVVTTAVHDQVSGPIP